MKAKHKFADTQYGTVGLANEKCPKLNRDFDREMRHNRDLGLWGSHKIEKLYTFAQK